MKNDERCAYGQTARSAFFRGVEPEAAPRPFGRAREFKDGRLHRGGSKDPQLRTGHTLRGSVSAGTYISRTYSFTMRRALKRGSTVRIDCLTVCSQRCGMPDPSRS